MNFEVALDLLLYLVEKRVAILSVFKNATFDMPASEQKISNPFLYYSYHFLL